ncbi:hypothetical protein [Paenibacillus contaminans]|uniref:Uncharacterized protein n=1 Tax=Paenibacillus contaminans TaxID=450362 RepID=A0A329MRR7_9BACL|nr:hypothetical protein [Paenibacillus contaminans]RAV22240.1 hypothetical protein DQG23_04615 [Paenibacillus contaminans]
MNMKTTLIHTVDFNNAMLFKKPVTVWLNGQIIEQGGIVEKHTEEAVYINGGYYLKLNCTFTI